MENCCCRREIASSNRKNAVRAPHLTVLNRVAVHLRLEQAELHENADFATFTLLQRHIYDYNACDLEMDVCKSIFTLRALCADNVTLRVLSADNVSLRELSAHNANRLWRQVEGESANDTKRIIR